MNGQHDGNGTIKLRLGWIDIFKLMGAGLTITGLAIAAAISVSGIYAHMEDNSRHLSDEKARVMMESITNAATDRVKEYMDQKFEAHNRTPHAGVIDRLTELEKSDRVQNQVLELD